MFFCQVLQYSRTIVLLKKLKPLKKPLFQKRRWSCDFLPRKTPVAQKHRAISRKKKWHSLPPPPSGCLGTPLPLPQSLCGRTDGHVTITSQPKFLGSIGYQICLAMELHWRALPAGSTIRNEAFMTATEIDSPIGKRDVHVGQTVLGFNVPHDETCSVQRFLCCG